MKKFLLILGIILFFGGIFIMFLPEEELKVFGVMGIFSGATLFLYGLTSPKDNRKTENPLGVVKTENQLGVVKSE